MPLSADVIEKAPELAAGVVRDWSRLKEQAPWSGPDPIGVDHLEDLIRQLGEAALARKNNGSASKELIREAFEHGRARRDDGFTDDMLFREFHLIRQGLWEQLKRSDPEDAATTIMRIDAEITMATAASMHGFFSSPDEVDDDALVETIARRWTT